MLKITEEARSYIIEILKRNKSHGLSVKAIKGGCSGMQFKFASEENVSNFENKILIEDNMYLCIENSALIFVIGSTLKYKKTMTGSMLVFEKANWKGQCGCGKSFY